MSNTKLKKISRQNRSDNGKYFTCEDIYIDAEESESDDKVVQVIVKPLIGTRRKKRK